MTVLSIRGLFAPWWGRFDLCDVWIVLVGASSDLSLVVGRFVFCFIHDGAECEDASTTEARW